MEDFDRLKSYLNDLDFYPDKEELERIRQISVKQDAYNHNKGIRVKRIESNPREKAFHDQWLKENNTVSGVNYGRGILQDLFIENENPMLPFSGTKVLEDINNRDRMIVATVIQWLGSNVGMSFLYEALRRFNARIVEDAMKTER